VHHEVRDPLDGALGHDGAVADDDDVGLHHVGVGEEYVLNPSATPVASSWVMKAYWRRRDTVWCREPGEGLTKKSPSISSHRRVSSGRRAYSR
jgi:hypothetical protein